MKTKLISSIVVAFLFSCKKEHTCVCSYPNVDPKGIIINDTKSNAKRICENSPNDIKYCKLIK
ncbi:MAG: hypothetical protein H7331_09510 [Bacteroidia bacterium]|nr:hypothetical protein [Bacteroidia bacterium]